MKALEYLMNLLKMDEKKQRANRSIKDPTPSRGGHPGSNNHSQGESKARRKMADRSHKINRKHAKRGKK